LTIYDIDDRLRELEYELTEAYDEDTGEILNEERASAVMAEMDALDMARDKKIEGALLLRQELLEEKASLDNEIKRLTARKKKRDRRAERLKDYVTTALGGEKFKTDKISVSYRKSESVDIAEGAEIPDEYVRVKVEANKTELKKALKSGVKIQGVTLKQNVNMIIK
jgi:hypothetical protein